MCLGGEEEGKGHLYYLWSPHTKRDESQPAVAFFITLRPDSSSRSTTLVGLVGESPLPESFFFFVVCTSTLRS